MSKIRYILQGKTPVPCDDLHEWARWHDENNDKRRVCLTQKKDRAGHHVEISTVFLGLDYGSGGDSAPILFETMVFADCTCEHDQRVDRYSTWEDAEAGHQEIVKQVEWCRELYELSNEEEKS